MSPFLLSWQLSLERSNQSILYLFGGRTLSLEDLQSDAVDLSSSRLVTLSVCETGITDIVKGSADEFVGLPAGFIRGCSLRGQQSLVSSRYFHSHIDGAVLFQPYC